MAQTRLLLGLLGLLGLLELPGLLAHRDPKALLAMMVQTAQLPGQRDLKGHKVLKDLLVTMVQTVR